MTPPTVPEAGPQPVEPTTLSKSFWTLADLRTFIEGRYGSHPPRLVYVSGIALETGGGVRYRYSDGSVVEGKHSAWFWYAPNFGPGYESENKDPIR